MGSRKPRQFSYRPRYYSPEQEQLNQQRVDLGIEESMETAERRPGDIIRAKSLRRKQMAEQEEEARRKSNRLRVLFVVVLIVGFIMLLQSIRF